MPAVECGVLDAPGFIEREKVTERAEKGRFESSPSVTAHLSAYQVFPLRGRWRGAPDEVEQEFPQVKR